MHLEHCSVCGHHVYQVNPFPGLPWVIRGVGNNITRPYSSREYDCMLQLRCGVCELKSTRGRTSMWTSLWAQRESSLAGTRLGDLRPWGSSCWRFVCGLPRAA
jgi:hypothetical protein